MTSWCHGPACQCRAGGKVTDSRNRAKARSHDGSSASPAPGGGARDRAAVRGPGRARDAVSRAPRVVRACGHRRASRAPWARCRGTPNVRGLIWSETPAPAAPARGIRVQQPGAALVPHHHLRPAQRPARSLCCSRPPAPSPSSCSTEESARHLCSRVADRQRRGPAGQAAQGQDCQFLRPVFATLGGHLGYVVHARAQSRVTRISCRVCRRVAGGCLHACRRAFPLPACLHACMPACMLPCLPASLPPCLPPSLFPSYSRMRDREVPSVH